MEVHNGVTVVENMLEYNPSHYTRGDSAHDPITDASPFSLSLCTSSPPPPLPTLLSVLLPLAVLSYIPLHPSPPISLPLFLTLRPSSPVILPVYLFLTALLFLLSSSLHHTLPFLSNASAFHCLSPADASSVGLC